MKKLIIGLLLLTLFLGIMSMGTCAEESNTYTAQYTTKTYYVSEITYEKEYLTTWRIAECIKNPVQKVDFEVVVGEVKLQPDKTEKYSKCEKFKVNLLLGDKVKETAEGTLVEGKNEIELKFTTGIGQMIRESIYKITIQVDSKNSDKIANIQNWKQIDKPLINWNTEVAIGKLNGKEKIEIGGKRAIDKLPKWAMGKVFYYKANNKPSDLFFTQNKKLTLGDNKLETKPILIKCGKMAYWAKWEFTINLVEIPEQTTNTPSATPTSEAPTTVTPQTTTVTPQTTTVTPQTATVTEGTTEDTLPKTGEENPQIYFVLGIIAIITGSGFFILRKVFK